MELEAGVRGQGSEVGVQSWRVRSRRWSEGPSEGIRRIRRGLPEEEPSDTADDIQDLRLAVERRFERADTAYPPRFREEKPSDTADDILFWGQTPR